MTEQKKKEHRTFIRVSWHEAKDAMLYALQQRYGAKGGLKLMKEISYEGVHEFYDEPDYVDIYLEHKN